MTLPTPCIGTKKQASHRNRRFQQPQYTLGIHHNRQRRRICGAMGGLKQPVTHTQHEIDEIIPAIWKKGYNTDLIFVSVNISDMCEKSVLDNIPRTQHRPICVCKPGYFVLQPTTFRRRFNLKTDNWDGISTELDAAIEEVNAIQENY